MAAFDYVNAHAVAVKLITKFGQPNNIVIKGNSSGWDDSGNQIPIEPDTIISGIVTPLLKYKQAEIDGESVLMTDSYVFFESDTPPEIDMMITINSQQFRIKDLTTLDSVDGINVYRKLQLHR